MSDEAKRIEAWARTWDYTYRKLAKKWSDRNSFLVVSAALFATAAGATGLGNVWRASLVPGVLALVAAAISGVTSALGASSRTAQYNTAASSNSGLADAALGFQLTVVEDLPIAEVRGTFAALCKRRDTVVTSAPVSNGPEKLTKKELAAWPPGYHPELSGDPPKLPFVERAGR